MEVQYGGGAREEHKVNISSMYHGKELLWRIFNFKIGNNTRVVIDIKEEEEIEEVKDINGKIEKLIIRKKNRLES